MIKKEKMKKTLLLSVSFLIFLATNQLTAYTVYNHSNTEYAKKMGLSKKNIKILIYKNKTDALLGGIAKAKYELKPGESGSWNWKDIGENRTKIWYFDYAQINRNPQKFPIGGAIVFWGYKSNKLYFQVYFDKVPQGDLIKITF